jgi:membrane protease subunit (stomatin/prohibitin family)
MSQSAVRGTKQVNALLTSTAADRKQRLCSNCNLPLKPAWAKFCTSCGHKPDLAERAAERKDMQLARDIATKSHLAIIGETPASGISEQKAAIGTSCKRCDAKYLTTVPNFCLQCGTSMNVSVAAVKPPAGPSTVKTGTFPPNCHACNHLNVGNDKFCTSCGAKRQLISSHITTSSAPPVSTVSQPSPTITKQNPIETPRGIVVNSSALQVSKEVPSVVAQSASSAEEKCSCGEIFTTSKFCVKCGLKRSSLAAVATKATSASPQDVAPKIASVPVQPAAAKVIYRFVPARALI